MARDHSGWSRSKDRLNGRLPADMAPWVLHDIRRSIPAEQQIPAFAREIFRASVEITGAQVYELFSAWWLTHCQGELMPRRRSWRRRW